MKSQPMVFEYHHAIKPIEIRSLVARPDPVILDIGCNDGTDSLAFLDAMPGASIYCFEPDPRAIARFRGRVSNPQIHLTTCALGDRVGETIFHGSSGIPPERQRRPGAPHYCLLPEWDLSGSIAKPTGHLSFSPWVTFPEDRRFTVQLTTLDRWMNGHNLPHIDFIWMDVQGYESSVIRGATESLSITRHLYMEFCTPPPLYEGQVSLEELTDLLPSFDLVGIYGRGREANALFQCKSQS